MYDQGSALPEKFDSSPFPVLERVIRDGLINSLWHWQYGVEEETARRFSLLYIYLGMASTHPISWFSEHGTNVALPASCGHPPTRGI